MNILLIGAWSSAKESISEIESLGHQVIFMQNEKDTLPCAYEEVEGIICNGLFLYHDIKKFTSLKYIQLISAGFDRVPMEYVKDKKIEIHNAHGVYSIPMAEFALCGVLQLYKQSKFFCENQKARKWEKHRGLLELYGKTVCIVGCGSVGTECAKRFFALGCRVIGVDLHPHDNPFYEESASLDYLEEKLTVSDIVILTLPLTNESRNLMNEKRFACMKNWSVLVNIARGAIVNTNALIDVLENKLYGAVIDVFEDEPLNADSPLWNIDNVVLTPHNSFIGDRNNERLGKLIINNLKARSGNI